MATGIRSLIDTTRSYAAMPPGGPTQAFLQNKLAGGNELEKIAAALVTRERKQLRDAQNIMPEEQSVIEKMAGLGRIMPDPSIQPGVDPRNMMAGIMQEAAPVNGMSMESPGGVAELPVDDTFYAADGGIIGFQDGNIVPTEDIEMWVPSGGIGTQKVQPFTPNILPEIPQEVAVPFGSAKLQGSEEEQKRRTAFIAKQEKEKELLDKARGIVGSTGGRVDRVLAKLKEEEANAERLRLEKEKEKANAERPRLEKEALGKPEPKSKSSDKKESNDLAEFLQRLGLGIMSSDNPRFLGAAGESALAAWGDISKKKGAAREAAIKDAKAQLDRDRFRLEEEKFESEGRITLGDAKDIMALREGVLTGPRTDQEYETALKELETTEGSDIEKYFIFGTPGTAEPIPYDKQSLEAQKEIDRVIEKNRIRNFEKNYGINISGAAKGVSAADRARIQNEVSRGIRQQNARLQRISRERPQNQTQEQ